MREIMGQERQIATEQALLDLPPGVRTAMASMMLRRASRGWVWRQWQISERKAEMMARRGQK
jgi:hypothetical protein